MHQVLTTASEVGLVAVEYSLNFSQTHLLFHTIRNFESSPTLAPVQAQGKCEENLHFQLFSRKVVSTVRSISGGRRSTTGLPVAATHVHGKMRGQHDIDNCAKNNIISYEFSFTKISFTIVITEPFAISSSSAVGLVLLSCSSAVAINLLAFESAASTIRFLKCGFHLKLTIQLKFAYI